MSEQPNNKPNTIRVVLEGPELAVAELLANEMWPVEVGVSRLPDHARLYVSTIGAEPEELTRCEAVALSTGRPRFGNGPGGRVYIGLGFLVSVAGIETIFVVDARNPLHHAAIAPGDVLHAVAAAAEGHWRVVAWEPSTAPKRAWWFWPNAKPADADAGRGPA